jgi:hypothetical protein
MHSLNWGGACGGRWGGPRSEGLMMPLDRTKMSAALVVLSAAVLLAIWPLPDTIALRNLALLVGFGASAVVLHKNRHRFVGVQAWPVYMLFSFFFWVLLHNAFLARNPEEQWQELSGEWLRNFLACAIGLALGLILADPENQLPRGRSRPLQRMLILGFAGTVSIYCARYGYEVFQTKQWLHADFFMIPFRGKTALVIFGSIFLPLMFIKILDAVNKKAGGYWYFYALAGITATLAAYFLTNTKNGFAIFALLFALFLFKIFIDGQSFSRHGMGFKLLLAFVILAFGIVAKNHLETNPAWSNLIADYKVSVQIERHDNWKDNVSDLPVNEFKRVVNGSTYQRVTWGRAGLELITENPWGFGLINHSFGALAIKKWSDFHQPDGKNRGATHSGWIDFTLGFGVLGLLLVWTPLAVAFSRARKRTDFWSRYAVWAIPVIFFTYLTTEVCTGHFIELLFFMAALFTSLTLPHPSPATAADAD